MEKIRLINQPLKAVGLIRPKTEPQTIKIEYVPATDEYVRFMREPKLYWKPF